MAASLAGLAGAGISALPANGDLLVLWLSAVAIIVLGVGSIVWAQRAHFDLFQPLGLVAIFHILGFAAGGLYWWYSPAPTLRGVSQAGLASAALLDAGGFALFIAGYRYSPLARRGALGVMSRIPAGPSPGEATPLAFFAVLLGVGWIARLQTLASGSYFHFNPSGAIVGNSSWSFVIDGLAALPTVVVAYLLARDYMRARTKGRSGPLSTTALVLLAVEFVWVLPSGGRGQLLSLVLMVFLTRYYGLRRLPSVRALTLSVVLSVIVIFPLVLSYRSSSGTNYQTNAAVSLQNAVSRYVETSWSERLGNGLDATFTRFSEVPYVAAIVEGGPRASGLHPGETFSWAITGFIPRAIDPHKQDPGFFGNYFARTYGFVGPRDRLTALSVTQVGELYMNFGALGVLGMAAFGMLFRPLSDLTLARRRDPLVLALYAVLAWPLINGLEGIFAGAFLGVIKLALLLAAVSFGAMWIAGALRFRRREEIPQVA